MNAVYLSDGDVRRAEHLDVTGRALALDMVTGDCRELVALDGAVSALLDPFGVLCELGTETDHDLNGAVGVHVVLASFWVARRAGTRP